MEKSGWRKLPMVNAIMVNSIGGTRDQGDTIRGAIRGTVPVIGLLGLIGRQGVLFGQYPLKKDGNSPVKALQGYSILIFPIE